MCAVTRSPRLCASSMMAAYCAGVSFSYLPSRVVDPDLDDVGPVRRVLLNRLAGFRLAR